MGTYELVYFISQIAHNIMIIINSTYKVQNLPKNSEGTKNNKTPTKTMN